MAHRQPIFHHNPQAHRAGEKNAIVSVHVFDIETGKAFEKIPSTVNRISFPNIHEFNEGTMQAFKYLPHIKRDLHFESAKLSEFPLELATHISETNVYLHPNTIISDEVKLILGDRIKPIPGVKPTKKLPQINTKKASQSTTTNTTINTMSMGNKNKKTDADKLQESITDPYRQEPKKSEESRSGYTPNPKISSLTPIDGEKENTNNISPDSSQSNY